MANKQLLYGYKGKTIKRSIDLQTKRAMILANAGNPHTLKGTVIKGDTRVVVRDSVSPFSASNIILFSLLF
jgi:hypothetical protein